MIEFMLHEKCELKLLQEVQLILKKIYFFFKDLKEHFCFVFSST